MVRTATAKKLSLKNGTQYNKYHPKQLEAAIRDVRERDVALSDAAAAHAVPRETLRRRLAGTPAERQGPPTVLSAAEEADITYYLLKMADMGLALDRAQVAQHVLDIVSDGRDHPWSDGDTTGPGRDWWEGFLRRHPELALRKAQELERARATMSNEFVLNDFFEKLRSALIGVRPELLFNCDETKVDGKMPRVFARKGQRAVNAIADAPMKHVSVVGCGNATGSRIMWPALVTEGVNVQMSWYDPSQKDMLWAASESGWMESDMFASWVDQFIAFIDPDRVVMADCKKEPALLLFDGHSTHVTLKAIERAEKAGVRLLKLPAHTTHLVQPLDLACFGPWHKHWGRRLLQFRVQRPRAVVTKEIFAALYREPWDKAMSPENLRNGFKAAGIHPFNPKAVLDRVAGAITTPATALDADPAQSAGAGAAARDWPRTPSPAPWSPGSTASSSSSHHTPKFELVAQIDDLTRALMAKDKAIDELQRQLEEQKTLKRRRDILRFPFEDASGAPPTKRKRVMVNGAEFLSVAAFNAKAAEALAERERSAELKKVAAQEKAGARRAERAAAKAAATAAAGAASSTAPTTTRAVGAAVAKSRPKQTAPLWGSHLARDVRASKPGRAGKAARAAPV